MFEDLSGLCANDRYLVLPWYDGWTWRGRLLQTHKARITPVGGQWASDCPEADQPGYGKTPREAFDAMLPHLSEKARRDFLSVTPI